MSRLGTGQFTPASALCHNCGRSPNRGGELQKCRAWARDHYAIDEAGQRSSKCLHPCGLTSSLALNGPRSEALDPLEVTVALPTDGRLQSWLNAITGLGSSAAAFSGHVRWWAPILALAAVKVLPFAIDRTARFVERLAIIFSKGTPAQIRSKAIALREVRA